MTNVPASCTEIDITAVMSKFGKIDNCYIPQMENTRSSKIAIVRYKFKEEASRAVEEREVNIEFSMVSKVHRCNSLSLPKSDTTRALCSYLCMLWA